MKNFVEKLRFSSFCLVKNYPKLLKITQNFPQLSNSGSKLNFAISLMVKFVNYLCQGAYMICVVYVNVSPYLCSPFVSIKVSYHNQ